MLAVAVNKQTTIYLITETRCRARKGMFPRMEKKNRLLWMKLGGLNSSRESNKKWEGRVGKKEL